MVRKLYVGKAGQLAVMAEFLLLGYNVAMPEVDEGDDVFVVRNQNGKFWRIQVKTGVGKRRRTGWRAKFAVAQKQIATEIFPDLFFVLALRKGTAWEFLIISRKQLRREVVDHQAGSASRNNRLFTVSFQDTAVRCSGRDWQAWRNNWSEWPVIQ
jgi:hypothetical protein